MERRGEDRDVRIPNFNPTQMMGQESPVKLTLTPIVSTPHSDRRGNATVCTRRGSAIFSPMQTLDHHNHHHHQQQQQLNPPPPQHPHVLKHPILDPDPPPPPPPPTTDHDGASNSKTQASSPRPPPQPPASPPPPANANNSTSIRYRECLKNHAASMGGHVVDGCGEFMPSGDEGTAEALRCAACDCHRNFHRKQVQGDNNPNSANININRIPLIHNQTPPSTAVAPPAMMNFGGSSGGPADESSSEDLNMTFQSSGGGHVMMQLLKKRFRTKFSQEQKERMQEFGEKLGWRIQKQDEQQVQRFCDETGVKRQVFKVWMHNNKQGMKKRQI